MAGLKRDSHYGIPDLPDGYTSPQALNRDEVKKVYDSIYPAGTRNTGQVAWVLLAIDATGKVTSNKLLVRSGDPALDKAAEAVGKVARFQPALDGPGKPAGVKVGYPVTARSQYGAVY